MSGQQPPADWYPDPLERFDYRYWDGARWTEHVSTDGSQELDPLDRPATADAAGEPVEGEGSGPGTATAAEGPGPLPADDEDVREAAGVDAAEVDATGAAATAPSRMSAPTGLRGELLTGHPEIDSRERVSLQNEKMLKVVLGDDVLARQGSVVAFQGSIDFDYEAGGGVAKFLKKTASGEGLPLMRCTGDGHVFLAHDADDVHVVWLDGGGLSVNGQNLLAFDPGLNWDIARVQGAGSLGAGLFSTTLRGSGWVAITTHGTPVTLQVDQPTFADGDAAVAWSADLDASIEQAFEAKALAGRGAGEVAQLAFTGRGFVVVQASEGPAVPAHDHG